MLWKTRTEQWEGWVPSGLWQWPPDTLYTIKYIIPLSNRKCSHSLHVKRIKKHFLLFFLNSDPLYPTCNWSSPLHLQQQRAKRFQRSNWFHNMPNWAKWRPATYPTLLCSFGAVQNPTPASTRLCRSDCVPTDTLVDSELALVRSASLPPWVYLHAHSALHNSSYPL